MTTKSLSIGAEVLTPLEEAALFLRQDPIRNPFLFSFLIGEGNERSCFFLQKNADIVLKISRKSQAKQTRREIKYFSFLMKKKVPFLHIPQFFGKLQTKEYICFLQKRILNENGKSSVTLAEYLLNLPSADLQVKKEVLMLLADFFRYLYRYNIIPCDLQTDNLLIEIKNTQKKLFIVDGLGNTDILKTTQYFPWQGRRKIIRKIIFFLKDNPELISLFNNPQDIEPWVYEQIKNPRS